MDSQPKVGIYEHELIVDDNSVICNELTCDCVLEEPVIIPENQGFFLRQLELALVKHREKYYHNSSY